MEVKVLIAGPRFEAHVASAALCLLLLRHPLTELGVVNVLPAIVRGTYIGVGEHLWGRVSSDE